MSEAKRRKTSIFAQARQSITIPALILAGYVKIGDRLLYEYHQERYTAVIISGGRLAGESDKKIIDNPTSWTEACISEYNQVRGKTVHTRASPYSRITVESSGKNLQDMRNQYMEEFVKPPKSLPTPADVCQRVHQRHCLEDEACGAPSTEDAPPPLENLAPPIGNPLTVQMARASLGTNSYRDIAYLFEKRYNPLCAKVVALTKRLGESDSAIDTLKAAVSAAKRGLDVSQMLLCVETWQRTPFVQHTEALAAKEVDATSPMSSSPFDSAANVQDDTKQTHTVFSSSVILK